MLGVHAYHKDCQVTSCDVISERYALVEVQIPLPVGGYHKEILPLDTIVEIRKSK